MKYIGITTWTYLIFVLHTGIARDLTVAGCVPNLLLAGLVLLLVRVRGRSGIAMAAAWGLLSDALTDGRLGPDVICFSLTAYAVRQFHARWNLNSPWKSGVLSSVVVAGEMVAATSLRLLADGRSPELSTLGAHAVGSALYTGILVAGMSLAARLVLRQTAESTTPDAPTVSNQWRMLTG